MKRFLLSLSCIFSLTSIQVLGAEFNQQEAASGLEEQFNRLKRQSTSYQEFNRPYKVVEVRKLDQFWENVQATLQAQEKNLVKSGKATASELEKANATIAAQNNQLEALRQANAAKTQAVQENAFQVSNISILGLGINKQVFLIVSFSLIGLLLTVVAWFYASYKKSKVVAVQKVSAFQELEQEFSEFRKTSRDRELKIKRQLQTEVNTREEMQKELASLQKLTL